MLVFMLVEFVFRSEKEKFGKNVCPGYVHSPGSGFRGIPAAGSTRNLEMLLFEERGKPENPGRRKTSRGSRVGNQETRATWGVG